MFILPSSDITFGRRELVAVRTAAGAGDWDALSRALSADVADDDDRSYRVTVAAHTIARHSERLRPSLERWATTEPTTATAALLLGAVEVGRAWKVRGYALAADTEAGSLRSFVEVLGRAELWCRTAADLDRTDPTPWQWLLHMARGQQVGLAETLARRAGLVAVSPDHFMGHYMAVGSLSPMWGCPREVMYAQVRDWTSTAADGSLLHALVFVAHVERWRRSRVAADDFLGDPVTRADAERAGDLMRMEPCRRPAEFWAHNYAAGWYSLIGDHKRATRHFKLLGNRRTEWPWEDFARFGGLTFATRRLSARCR
jgi:hypothetical protein